MRRGPKTSKLNEDLYARLAHRYSFPDWYTVYEVAVVADPDDGGDGKWRSADAFAVSTWASRSWEIHGVEVKATRSDWLAELREPAKADAAIRLCRKWWLLTPEWVVEAGELPEGWGHLVPSGTGLRAAVEAKPRQAEEPPRRFWMHVLRRMFHDDTITRRVHTAYENGRREGTRSSTEGLERNLQYAKNREAEARGAVAEFEKASGVKIADWNAGRIGEAVAAVLANAGLIRSITSHGDQVRRRLDELDEAVRAAVAASPVKEDP